MLRCVREGFVDSEYSGERAAECPELLVSSGVTGLRVRIELKRPRLDITCEHEAATATSPAKLFAGGIKNAR